MGDRQTTNIIEVKNLNKEFKSLRRKEGIKSILNLVSRDYKTIKALNKIDLEIKKGEFVGIIGPNGAGKSTLIKTLTGILTPTSGYVKVLNLIPYKSRQEYAKHIGVVFGQRTQLWWDLPAKYSFDLLRSVYKIPDSTYKNNMKTFEKILGIDKFLDTPIRKLSLGERMRCDLAASLLHNPEIVYLDEPTIGLDVEAKHRMREFLKELNKKGTTIILTTHDMGDIEELCERIVIIDHGKKIYDGSITEIKKRFGKERVLVIEFHKEVSKSDLRIKNIKFLGREGNKVRLEINAKKTSVTDVIKKIISRYSVHDIEIEEPEVEEIIREIYRKGV